MKQVLDETGANGTAFTHKHFSDTNHAQQIIVLSNDSDEHILMMPSLKNSKKHEPLLTRTGHIINHGDDRLETQPTPQQHVDKVLNNTLDDETPTMFG